MKNNKNNKKTIILSGVGILILLLTIIGATYAYFAADLGGGTNANINASTGTTDSLTFDAGDPIRIHASLENFAEGMESLKGSTTATATLKANNTTNQASGKYNIFFVIDDNDFVYSTEDGQAELVLKVTDSNGNEVEEITGLKRVENGFDITTRTGGFLVRADYEIETTSTTNQAWNIEVTLVNLDSNQNVNNGKSFHGKFYITTEQLNTYETAKINSVETNTTYNSITANLNTMAGTSEIDKYYYAIEEDTSAVALLGLNKVARLAAKELNYIESEESSHTFDNLKPNTSYKVYSYAKDKEGINSNVYETSITTEEYILPKVTGLTHTSELYKITVTATSEAGSNEVSKYYFSKDNGATWSEGQESPTYVFDNLLDTTTYNIKVKVSDKEDKYSTEYFEAIATSAYINPSITTVTNTKNYNSIILTVMATKGINEISKYYFSKDNGSTWTAGQASNVYTYTGLSENTTYNIKVKVEDTLGRMSNPYSLDVTTNTYRIPSVSVTTTKTSSSITISATGTKGDGNIAKYMYSKDGGSNWTTKTSTSTTNSYTFSGLTSNTSYSIRVKVVDNNNRESSVYSVSVTTSYVNPTASITSTSQTSNSITVNAKGTAGSKTIAKYMFSSNGGSTWTTKTTSATTSSHTFTGLSGGTTYSIRVKVVDSGGKESTVVSKSITTDVATLAATCAGQTMSTCFKNNYTLDDSLYYHSDSLAYGAGDYSYRYAGANPNNYVCFGSTATTCPSNNLYRIIGIFGNQVKLIKNTSIGDYYWASYVTAVWSESSLNTNILNGTYLSGLGTTWSNKIATTSWIVGSLNIEDATCLLPQEVYNMESRITTTYNAKVGLMYLNDYLFSAYPDAWSSADMRDFNCSDGRLAYNDSTITANNWLHYAGRYEWTIRPDSSWSNAVCLFYPDGRVDSGKTYAVDDEMYISRPTFYLNSTVTLLSGTGTQSNPYQIS